MCLISGWGAHTGRGSEDPTNPQERINQSLPPSPPPHPGRLPDDWAAGPHRGHHGDLQLCPDGDRDGHDQHVWIHLSWSCKWAALMDARLSWDGRHCIPHHITHGACSTILSAQSPWTCPCCYYNYTGWPRKNATTLIVNFKELIFVSLCGKFIFQHNDTMIINFG